MGRLLLAITAAVMLSAAAAQVASGNGVESFDGTIQDANTPTGSPASSAVQATGWSLSFGGTYTEQSFTVGVGQGVRVTVFTENTFYAQSNYMSLTDLQGQSIGLGVWWRPEVFYHNFPPTGPGGIFGYRGTPNGSVTVAKLREWMAPPSTFDLEIDRLDQNLFKFSAWGTSSNVLIGSYIADVSRSVPGGVAQDVPSDLYVKLSSGGTGSWSDIRVVAAPEPGTAGLILGFALTLTRRHRTRTEEHRLAI